MNMTLILVFCIVSSIYSYFSKCAFHIFAWDLICQRKVPVHLICVRFNLKSEKSATIFKYLKSRWMLSVIMKYRLYDTFVRPHYTSRHRAYIQFSRNQSNSMSKFSIGNFFVQSIIGTPPSGKLTTSLVEYWRDNMFVPSITDSPRTLLLSDSWPGQGDAQGIYEKIRNCKRMEIPPKTTAKIQPLDVFSNHEYKGIARRVYDRVILDDIDIQMAQRNNIMRLHSLNHNQISAPIYKPIIRYAWFKSGHLHNHPGQFQTVTDVCFKLSQPHCDISSCDSFSFIRCSYCRKILCVNHFFIEYHMH